MSISAGKLLHQVMQLSATDRAALVDEVMSTLDKPNPTLDADWLREAEERMAAYVAGELGAVDVEEAFAELGRKT